MTVKPLFVGQQQSTTPAEELSATKSSYIFTQCNHLPPTYESEGYSESYELWSPTHEWQKFNVNNAINMIYMAQKVQLLTLH